jgi:hypothetical protein
MWHIAVAEFPFIGDKLSILLIPFLIPADAISTDMPIPPRFFPSEPDFVQKILSIYA